MDKYKYQFIAIIFTLCVGGIAGYLFSKPSQTEIQKLVEERVKELTVQNQKAQYRIDSMELALVKIDSVLKHGENKRRELNQRIKQDSIRMRKLLKKVPQMTPSEKTNWLIDRYRPK